MNSNPSMLNDAQRVRFAVLLAATAVVLTAPRLFFHELWRDEAGVWLNAIESPTLPALFKSLSWDGHGYLFPVLCWLVARFSSAWQAMQVLNLAIVGASTYVLARFAPLRRTECVLLALGYFFFYEYAVLSRHYGAGVLIVWLACTAARSRPSVIGLGAALGVLCQTTVYGYIIALSIGAGFVLDRYWRRHELDPVSLRDALIGAALAAAGAVAGLFELVPAPGGSFAAGWRFGWDTTQILAVLQMPWHAFVPLTQFDEHFWNTDVLSSAPEWRATAGAAALVLAAIILWPRRLALLVFGIGAVGLLGFGYVKYLGSNRHHGHLWLLFVAAIWIAGGLGREGERRSWREVLLLGVLVAHCVAMVFASLVDLQYPFSNGANTAELIRRQGLDRYPLLGYREPPAASVAVALGQPLYSPARQIYTTHPDWGPDQRDLSLVELRCAARDLSRREARDIVLVMNSELPRWPEIEPAGAQIGAIVPTENYFLYRLKYSELANTAFEARCGG